MKKNRLKMLTWFLCMAHNSIEDNEVESLFPFRCVFTQYCLRPSVYIAHGNNRNMNTLTAEGQYDSFPDDGGCGDISQVSCLNLPLESWTRE